MTLGHGGGGSNLSVGLTLSVQISNFDSPLIFIFLIVKNMDATEVGILTMIGKHRDILRFLLHVRAERGRAVKRVYT